MDILLDHDLLIFTREKMLEEEVIRCRDGKRFEEKYLRKGFLEKISVIRILDSRRENFKLQIANSNGHLCHIRRTARDIISGQTGTH